LFQTGSDRDISSQYDARRGGSAALCGDALAAQAGGIAIAPANDFNYVTGHVERRRRLPSDDGEGDNSDAQHVWLSVIDRRSQ